MEEHDSGGPAGGDGRQPDSDRRYREDGEHRHAAGVCHRISFRHGFAVYKSQPTSAVSNTLGASDSDPRRSLERIHDVQAGLGELGASDYLAGDWPGPVLHLWPETQSRAGPGSQCRTQEHAHNGELKLMLPLGLPPDAEGLFVL